MTATLVDRPPHAAASSSAHPQLVVVGTIQGAMFLLIFRYVFGGAINVGSPAVRRLPRARLRRHDRALHRHGRVGRRRRGRRAGLRRPAAIASDPAARGRRGPGARRHGHRSCGASAITTAHRLRRRVPRRHRCAARRSPRSALCVVFGFAFRVCVHLHRALRRQRTGRAGHCRSSCSPSRSCRARTSPLRPCRRGCAASPATSRSRS